MSTKLKEKISDFAYNEGLSDVRFTDPKVDLTEFNHFKEFIQKGYHGRWIGLITTLVGEKIQSLCGEM
tara:strand:- start:1836 stop:2039 length:204 start_codon:yes stop_codon:yes gene_type:complete